MLALKRTEDPGEQRCARVSEPRRATRVHQACAPAPREARRRDARAAPPRPRARGLGYPRAHRHAAPPRDPPPAGWAAQRGLGAVRTPRARTKECGEGAGRRAGHRAVPVRPPPRDASRSRAAVPARSPAPGEPRGAGVGSLGCPKTPAGRREGRRDAPREDAVGRWRHAAPRGQGSHPGWRLGGGRGEVGVGGGRED